VCKYWAIFKGENDWCIINTVPRKDADPLDIEEAQREVLGGIVTQMAEAIQEGSYGAVMTEDEDTHGYYIVRWASVPFASQEDTDEWMIGELICDATYHNPVGRARNWYTAGDDCVTIRVQHVVAADLELQKPSNQIKLPSTCNRREALNKKATRLSDDSHLRILDEINRRDILDYEEDEEEESDDENISQSTGESSGDDTSDDDSTSE
jgi:hypothetical protein